jgi:hypothetical protein
MDWTEIDKHFQNWILKLDCQSHICDGFGLNWQQPDCRHGFPAASKIFFVAPVAKFICVLHFSRTYFVRKHYHIEVFLVLKYKNKDKKNCGP